MRMRFIHRQRIAVVSRPAKLISKSRSWPAFRAGVFAHAQPSALASQRSAAEAQCPGLTAVVGRKGGGVVLDHGTDWEVMGLRAFMTKERHFRRRATPAETTAEERIEAIKRELEEFGLRKSVAARASCRCRQSSQRRSALVRCTAMASRHGWRAVSIAVLATLIAVILARDVDSQRLV